MKHSKIEYWADERDIGNGIIVTLNYGLSFDQNEHEGVRGFDTVKEAEHAVRKQTYQCNCEECETND